MLENTVHLSIATLQYALEKVTDRDVIVGLKCCIRQLEIILETGPISDEELQGGLAFLERRLAEGGDGNGKADV